MEVKEVTIRWFGEHLNDIDVEVGVGTHQDLTISGPLSEVDGDGQATLEEVRQLATMLARGVIASWLKDEPEDQDPDGDA